MKKYNDMKVEVGKWRKGKKKMKREMGEIGNWNFYLISLLAFCGRSRIGLRLIPYKLGEIIGLAHV